MIGGYIDMSKKQEEKSIQKYLRKSRHHLGALALCLVLVGALAGFLGACGPKEGSKPTPSQAAAPAIGEAAKTEVSEAGTTEASKAEDATGAETTKAEDADATKAEDTGATKEAAAEAKTPTEGQVTLKVGATIRPHAEILHAAEAALAAAGIKLEVVEFQDYVQVNPALEAGEIDANYFQHNKYLDDYNAAHGDKLVALANIHYEPLGIYPGTKKDLAEIAEGDTIAVPNDSTNEGRALLLLQQAGLITLKDAANLTSTIMDIKDNPHKLNFKELDAAQIPRALPDVAYAVVNGNYALQAGLQADKAALLLEDKEGEAGTVYANVICVRKESADDPNLKKLCEVLKSEELQNFITKTYAGSVLPSK